MQATTTKIIECPPAAAARDCEGCPIFRECIAEFQEWAAGKDAARAV